MYIWFSFKEESVKQKPLKGIKILDLTRLLPGPMCTLHLADMGAEVLKIEDTAVGDYARVIPPIQNKNSFFFNAVNRNKRSVAIDFTKEQGRQLFFKLAETADVVVESFRPGVVKKLGIDYNSLKAINPRLVYCSITGYGQTGPYSNMAGHDLNFCAYAGILDRQGQMPFIPDFQIGDIAGGTLNAAMGILAALVQQKMTGVGQYIDVAMLDGVLAHTTTSLAQIDISEKSFLTGTLPCYSVYETSDNKYMALGALEFKFWERFCKAVDRPDLIPFHMVSGQAAENTFAEVTTIFKSNTRDYWSERLMKYDCCASPVLSTKEAINNEQVKARNMVAVKNHPQEGDVKQFALPLKFSSFQFEIEQSAPQLGQHTEEELLKIGCSEPEIKELRKNKIIL